jgi:hypothetical protein
MSFHVPEQYRFSKAAHPMTSDVSFGNNGVFLIPLKRPPGMMYDPSFSKIKIIASDELWEHVSASYPMITNSYRRTPSSAYLHRCPTWEEMCQVKALFWDPEDCVVQFHPPASQYINCHPFTLHLWRKVGSEFETPPGFMIGPRGNEPPQRKPVRCPMTKMGEYDKLHCCYESGHKGVCNWVVTK